MGGYVGSSETWASFNRCWRAQLDRTDGIGSFHAVDYFGSKGGWERFSPREGRAHLRGFIEVIRQHRLHAWLVSWKIRHYLACFRDSRSATRGEKRLTTPHAIGACYLLAKVLNDNQGLGHLPLSLQPIFDGHQQSGQAVRAAFRNEIKPALDQNFEFTEFLLDPVWKVGSEKCGHFGLQAADLLVWHERRSRLRDKRRVPPLLEHLRRASSRYPRTLSKAQLERYANLVFGT